MIQQYTSYDFSPVARAFVSGFIADLNKYTGSMEPQSQLVQAFARVGFDRTNSGIRGTILVPYIGGTIACEDKGRGLEPQPVESFPDFLSLHDISDNEIITRYPNTDFRWVNMPPPLDSGTMDEVNRVQVARFVGEEVKKIIDEGKNLRGVMPIHGTDSALKTQSRLAEIFSCSPIPFSVVSAQDAPGTWRGDGPVNIKDTLDLMHANITGHFVMCANEVWLPFDARKISDHGHMIYGGGDYGFGHYATMDSDRLTIHKSRIKQRSDDATLMPWHDPDFMRHYRNIDTGAASYKDYTDGNHGICFELPTNAFMSVIFAATQKIANGNADFKYVIVGSQGASNINAARKEFLKLASKAGICSIVVSEVKGATDASPYAAGARSSEHVTVISPDTVYDHTLGKFYISAAWTEYILDKYKISDEDAHKIRPLLFREIYQRQRGYDEAFIPGAQSANATIKDYALQLWRRSVASTPQTAIP